MQEPTTERAAVEGGKRQVASGKLDGKPEKAEPAFDPKLDTPLPNDRMTRRRIERQMEVMYEKGVTRGKAEAEALKQVAGRLIQANERQTAVIKELALSQLQVVELKGEAGSVLAVHAHHELAQEVIEDLHSIIKMPILMVPFDTAWEKLSVEKMEAAGWTRMTPRAVPAAAAE